MNSCNECQPSCSHASPPTESTPLLPPSDSERHSAFSTTQKRLIILAAAIASMFSPLSANIYFPALNSIAKDLRVSPSEINLTITTYMICQGLAPTFTGSLADQVGRRPAYIYCFLVYIAGNIALAIQHWFPALLILRAVQSCGSSGTVALSSAVAADIITPAERGAYMGIASLGIILAPSIGPLIGGFLTQYWGWKAVFWFLTSLSVLFFIPFLLFFPETCRAIVGDGRISPPRWNRPLWGFFNLRTSCQADHCEISPVRPASRIAIPNPWSSLRLLFCLPVGLVLFANGIIFGSYYALMTGIPAQFHTMYHLNDLGIGLCFIPAGLGSLLSAVVNGFFVDWNYRRIIRQSGMTTSCHKKQDILMFPIERARLQICLPLTLCAAGSIVTYGILESFNCPLWVALLLIFLSCFCIIAAYTVLNVLIVDLYYSTPATAMAANNLVRCAVGAGAAATVNPLIEKLGVRWTYGIVAATLLATNPLLLLVYFKGWEWRRVQAGIQF
ncbi:hypothetical protein N7532_009852 [Penicillium argentinense]|uniref:Major facilitator superfamily (MFS) profile domain-containing protein n=1 Tax=Penicillium argentinense TaxID=1131581 RepID=A0A9W9JXK3_9EURO|nr:uncharacterized protein N7532_009852 [Penicillium argentinense]KAJ5085081.1 hypothetical protein N7532_009852 [Penicillium argentinense]